MKVTFVLNLGSRDAESHGIEDWKKCVEGATVDVPDAAGKWLVENGIAKGPDGDSPAHSEHAHAHAHTHEPEKHAKK